MHVTSPLEYGSRNDFHALLVLGAPRRRLGANKHGSLDKRDPSALQCATRETLLSWLRGPGTGLI